MATSVQVERTIAASPATVFAAASDVNTWVEVVPAITKIELLTDGPVGVGTRFRETRKMFGKEATEEMEFLEYESPERYVLGAESHGCRYRTEFRFEPVPEGTRLVMDFGAEPLTTGAKVMAFLMKPMMRKMADMCAKDLDAIKAKVEGQG